MGNPANRQYRSAKRGSELNAVPVAVPNRLKPRLQRCFRNQVDGGDNLLPFPDPQLEEKLIQQPQGTFGLIGDDDFRARPSYSDHLLDRLLFIRKEIDGADVKDDIKCLIPER